MEGTKHAKTIEHALNKKGFATSALLIGQKGKPSTSNKGISRNQWNLYHWLNSNKFANINAELEGNIDFILGLLCWGYWSRTCKYSTNKIFEVHSLLQNLLLGSTWVVEP
jgi:hypothetical protein